MLITGETVCVCMHSCTRRGGVMQQLPVLYAQFFCEAKIALKNKLKKQTNKAEFQIMPTPKTN